MDEEADDDLVILSRLLSNLGDAEALDTAKRLIARLGSIGSVLAASPELLASIVGARLGGSIHTVRRTLLHCTRAELIDRPLLPSTTAVCDYLRLLLAHSNVEQVIGLFMTERHRLIHEEVLFRGSLSQAPCSPREVAGRALELGAANLIIAHNHPSGDAQPSKADLSATHALSRALKPLEIRLLDHLIVARTGIVSLHELGEL